MKLTIPNIKTLPPGHHLNRRIAALNSDPELENTHRASVAAAIIWLLEDLPKSAANANWISETMRLINGIELDVPTLEKVYDELVETEQLPPPPDKTDSEPFPLAFAYVIAIFCSSLALPFLLLMYKEYMVRWSGVEIQAPVVLIPAPKTKVSLINYLYVDIEAHSVPVMIGPSDYYQKRFQTGQKIAVKYLAPRGWAALTGKINMVLIFYTVFLTGLATLIWIKIFRTKRESSQKTVQTQ